MSKWFSRNQISVVALWTLFFISTTACTNESAEAPSKARGRRERLTIYCGIPSIRNEDLTAEMYDAFADSTGIDIDLVQFEAQSILNSGLSFSEVDWYARCIGSDPVDILDNLDLVIENSNFTIYNPAYGRSKPDMIIASKADQYIREKALSDYFVPVSDILDMAPQYFMAHGEQFWKQNSEDAGEFGIPLFSFIEDTPPGYWIIDSASRKAITDSPIESIDELLGYLEFIAASDSEDRPVISTGQAPLGSILLRMQHNIEATGILPIGTGEFSFSADGTSYIFRQVRTSTGSGYVMNPVRKSRLSTQLMLLSVSPLVYDASKNAVVNALDVYPEFREQLRRIAELARSGKIDTERDSLRGVSAMYGRSMKAVFVPEDQGFKILELFMKRSPEDFHERFEIIPFSVVPETDLLAMYAIWVPKFSDRMNIIAGLLETIVQRDTFEAIRYGPSPEYWTPDGEDGILPNRDLDSWPYLPTGSVIELISRSGLPDRIPAIISERARNAFRIDPGDDNTYALQLDPFFDNTPVAREIEEWSRFVPGFQELMNGTADFDATFTDIFEYGSSYLSVIQREFNRQLSSGTAR